MPKYVTLPDGGLFPLKEGENPVDALEVAQKLYPQAFGVTPEKTLEKAPESGFTPALKAGFKNLKGDVAALAGRAGLMDTEAAEKYKAQQEAEAQKIFKPTEEGWSEAPLTKLKELAGGSLPYMAAPAAAGAAAFLLPEAAAAAPVLGGLITAGEAVGAAGAGLASAAQFTGSNLSRQMEEGKKLKETDLGAAALAAVPQAALDVVSLKMIPGVRNILAAGGRKVTEEAAQQAAQQGIKNIAADYLKATGKTMGIEGLTEAGQQVFERLQAGLSLTDPSARQEYWDNFIGGAALGGVLAPGGRYMERGAEQAKAREMRDEEARKLEAQRLADEREAADALEAAKGTPEALKKLEAAYNAAQQQKIALDAKVAGLKVGKDGTEEQKAAYEEAKKERAAFLKESYIPLRQEYDKRKDSIAQAYEQQQADIEAGTAAQPEAKEAIPAEEPKRDVQKLMLEQDMLRNQLAQLEAQVDNASPEDFKALDEQRQQLQRRIDARATLIEEHGGTPLGQEAFQQAAAAQLQAIDTKIQKATDAFNTARQNRDEKAAELADELIALKQQRDQLTAKNAVQMQALQEKETGLTQRGQTRDLFAEAPAPAADQATEVLNEQILMSERDRANYGREDMSVQGRRKSAMEAFGLAEVGPRGQLEELPAQEDMFAQNVQPLRQKQLQDSATKLDDANAKLAEAVKSGDQKNIDAALRELNKYETQTARLAGPAKTSDVLDLFDPANILRTAIGNDDWVTANNYIAARDESKAKDLEAAGAERAALAKALDSRLGLGGEGVSSTGEKLRSVERTQNNYSQVASALAALYPKAKPDHWSKFLLNSERLLRSGSFPNADVQAKFDASPDAFAYDYVMSVVEDLKKKVETKQGNAKKSLLQRLIDLAEEEAVLLDRLETGIAKPTMREKVAAVNAKLGKGQAPTERKMDAAELKQAEKRLDKVREEYAAALGPVTAVKNEILKIYSTLHTVSPIETVARTAEKKAELAAAPAKEAVARVVALPELKTKIDEAKNRLKSAVAFNDAEEIESAKNELAKLNKIKRSSTTLSKEAKKAKRVEKANEAITNRQDPLERKEALNRVAAGLGKATDKFLEKLDAAGEKLAVLKDKYGADSEEVRDFREATRLDLEKVAIEEGRKTKEYREAVKNMEGESKPVYAKRTPETRKQSAAPSEIRGVSAEAKQAGEGKKLEGIPLRTAKARITRDAKKANAKNGGVAYRLREDGTEQTVDAAEAQKVIDGLQLPDNVKFVYAATPGQIPVRLLKIMAKEGVDPTEGMVQGAVFPDGTVLVVGDQHTDVTDLEKTIAHELIGHYGIDTVIGHARLRSFLKKTDVIELARRLGGDELVREVLNTVRASADLGRSEEEQKLHALREVIAHTEESRVTESFREKAGRWLKELVGMIRAGLRDMGFKHITELSTSDVFYMLKQSRKAFENKQIGPYKAADGGVAFRRRSEPSEYGIGRPAGVIDTMLGNMMGLAGRVQFVDQYAALEAAIKKGLTAKQISALEATNANYLLRFGQQRSQFAGQFLTNGPVRAVHTKKDGGVETVYKSEKGVSMMDVAKRVGEAGLGNDTEQEDMFTLYLAGKRANQVGWDKLNYTNPADAKAKYDKMMSVVNANPKAKKAFEDAAKLYQEYNAGLLDFLVDTGALSKSKADELKAISYVPFYRVNGDGEVQLVIDKEKSPVRIANIKDQPQLQQLVGGNTEIMPIFTSAAQNTFMLTGMGLRNQAVKETSFMLQKLGIASRVSSGMGPKGDNVVRFFKHGQPFYALIDTDAYGIPADLIVKGMEGIKTSMPAIIKTMGIPSQLLRNFVVRMPTYALRQIIRDPLNAWLTTGTDAAPILSSMKELASMVAGRSEAEQKLMEAGAISSNVYSGDEADMGKFLQDIAAGKSLWEKAIGRLDAFALQGDAATRAVIYKDSLAKGMTEQEALLRTLESMNFSRRGVSPSMHALSVMIPFFNAQVQGLDVIYRAFKGDMPFSEQTKIRAKMVQRGLMLAAGTIAYSAMMEDDEAYKRAKPEERYSNWFVYVPGVSAPVRVPIPFEMGFLFKALPEAVWNVAMQDEQAGKAAKGLGIVFSQTIPNPVPQAIKPGVEAVLGKSFYGGDIESAREKEMLATERYRDSTTELSKLIGSVTGKAGVSPIMLDHLIRGYTGGLGIALVQLANPILATDSREIAQPSTKPSKLPLIGGLFQPVEGRGTLDEAYDRMLEIRQVKGTYNKLLEEGRRAEAKEFEQNYATDLAAASVSGSVQQRLGAIAKMERQVRADPNMTTEQKDAKLEQLDKMKLDIARKFLAFNEKTKPQ